MTRFLLQKAYPLGYLPMRGVLTVGGWTSAGVIATYGEARWYPPEGWQHPSGFFGSTYSTPPEKLAAGEFLPLVDPADTATWACLLADLAEAAFGEPGTDGLRIRPSSANGDRWTIMGSSAPAPKTGNRLGLSLLIGIVPTLDPALALVRMRVVFRENEALLTGDKDKGSE